MDVGDLLTPTVRDGSVNISWKSSYYYFIEEINTYGDKNDNDNPEGIYSYSFKDENGKLFKEGFYFISNLIEKGLITIIKDDAIKAKLLLSYGLHND